MARIPHEDTPIYAQLLKERVAQAAYEKFFDLSEPVSYDITVFKPDVE